MDTVSRRQIKDRPEETPKGTEQLDQRETAAYIADAALGLQSLARRVDLPFLAYLLNMAAQEAIERNEAK